MKKPKFDIDVYLGDSDFRKTYSRWQYIFDQAEIFTNYIITDYLKNGHTEANTIQGILEEALMITYTEEVAIAIADVVLYDLMIKKMDSYDLPYNHNLKRKEYRRALAVLSHYVPM